MTQTSYIAIVRAGLFLLGQLLFVFTAQAGSCNKIEYKQFEFWIGRWDVFKTDGTRVGENTIQYTQDSCLIQENWIGLKQTGTSYTYFNTEDSSWNQVWVDNSGQVLVLKGHWEKDNMTLWSSWKMAPKGAYRYRDRITWQAQRNGSVLQRWEILSEDDKVVQVLFEGVYKRKK